MENNKYIKNNSFSALKIKKLQNSSDLYFKIKLILSNRIQELNSSKEKKSEKLKIIEEIYYNLFEENKKKIDADFILHEYSLAEIQTLSDNQIVEYLFHRYRYEFFPKIKKIDSYPPYLQIEPASVCNYRCVFCYQTDKSFSVKSSGHMGYMSFDLFKKVVDQAEKNIHFLSLASRGEPMLCPEIGKMLDYTKNKFINLKLNTNASLLNEKNINMILSSGVKTVVFSVDAADKVLYEKLRVNGKFEKVIKNIKLFNDIKKNDFPNSALITRVSGVKFQEDQKIQDMNDFWGGLVDHVAFVNYIPWENVYDSKKTNIDEACTDLWRRMFIWWDGTVNPCDVDYKSLLNVGNIKNDTIKNIWNGEKYQKLRNDHLSYNRKNISPCFNCNVC
jgi:radical SAM protein with 4Fe4S-binding SPASM domain